MDVKECKVNWYEDCANLPALKLTVDKLPPRELLRYEQRGHLYFAYYEGLVSFFYYEGPGTGYGGSTFNITMLDGTTRQLHGPWSSRAGVMNKVGFLPSLDVHVYEEATGHNLACAISLDLALSILPPGVVLVEAIDDTDITYHPAMWSRGGEVWLKKPVPTWRVLHRKENK